MVVKKSNIISIALLLALTAVPAGRTTADSGNNLVQLDLKRASNNSVNVTLFTSNGYNDNVMVRKKSDNKYVILIPKVQSSGYSASNLNGVRDLVSDVDVKTINDTSGGYTKVTLITTKPLDIKTSARKSTPVTEEQKEYNTLIAQANAVKNNIASKQEPPKKQPVQKTEITVNKAPAVVSKPAAKQEANQLKQSENNNTKILPKKAENKKVETKKTEMSEIKLTEVNPDRQARREQLAAFIKEVKQEKTAGQAPENTITHENVLTENTAVEAPVKDIKEMPKISSPSIFTKIKHKAKKSVKPIGIALASLFGLIALSKLVKSAASTSPKESFIDQLAKNQPVISSDKYDDITNNTELSWQEKYQSYLDASAKPVPRANNKGSYVFIKTPAVQKAEEKKQALEQMVSDISQVNITPDILPDIEPEIVEVQSEDNAIQNTIKFKAFDNHKMTLDMTSRDRIKSRFKKYENELPLREQKNVELGNSILHSNPRRLKDANLDVEDVKISPKFKPTEYIMSSADEYFSILDKEESVKKVQKTQRPKINKPEQPVLKIKKTQTNPITQHRNETKSSYINGLIVKSGYNIDSNKGFYVVNLDGKSALIGKVNDEVFVLKKFDTNVTNPIQVRHDNANVYMVKAGGFKSLVEVNNDKMGVLIEL